ncbi:MAG: APC family permease [Chthonomonadales bacterium]
MNNPGLSGDENRESLQGTAHNVHPLRKLLFGKPFKTEDHEHSLIPKITALPVFASDAISSVAYATQEMFLALSVAGTAALVYAQNIAIAIAILLVIVAISYQQTITAYPTGGGSYIVAKDNIGTVFGLIAAAALLIDYVLTVATSIAAGVQNLVPTAPMFRHHEVLLCVFFVLVLLIANLRGMRESGPLFAIPTYTFVLACLSLIFLGFLGPSIGWHYVVPSHPDLVLTEVKAAGLALILNAFARGCSAMTGTEAISDGVPSFQEPKAHNAIVTLRWMAAILATLFIGITMLAIKLRIQYDDTHHVPVIDQLNSIVFGKGSTFYYILQGSTVAILVLAANTSFADFPRLCSFLARDGFMPRQLNNLGDKLTFTNGIIMLGVCSIILLVAFGGNTDKLVPLYAIGVFIAFTLSQSGMVVHWFVEKGAGWKVKAVLNGVGAVATTLVLLTISYEKVYLDVVHNRGREFGWIVIVLICILYAMFMLINRHYSHLKRSLAMDNYMISNAPVSNTILVLVPRINRGSMKAIEYGNGLGGDVRGVHIEIDPTTSPLLVNEWEKWAGDMPLVILPSPYRSVVKPLLAYLDEVERERPGAHITVVVPEAVTGKWWHSLLHANYGALIKLYLLNRRNVIVANVRYFVDEYQPDQQDGYESIQ